MIIGKNYFNFIIFKIVHKLFFFTLFMPLKGFGHFSGLEKQFTVKS